MIKEVLRLFPALIGVAPRVALQDMDLDRIRVQKGQSITIATLVMQRSAAVWGPTAQEFNPDRHLKNADGHTNDDPGIAFVGGNYDFTAFGGGVRPCIGRHLSLMELKVATSLLVQRYRFVHLPTTSLGPYREHACTGPLPQLKVAASFELGVHVRNH